MNDVSNHLFQIEALFGLLKMINVAEVSPHEANNHLQNIGELGMTLSSEVFRTVEENANLNNGIVSQAVSPELTDVAASVGNREGENK